jgi:hypothetical protein
MSRPRVLYPLHVENLVLPDVEVTSVNVNRELFISSFRFKENCVLSMEVFLIT